MKTLLACLFACVFAGCASLQSLNLQRSGLRSAGDVGVTALLDQLPNDKWEAAHTEITDIVQRLTDFMSTGAVQDLVYPKLVDAVRSIIPDQYHSFGESLLAAVEHTGADVKVEKIGQNNIDRILAFLTGAGTGLRSYQVEHRPPSEDQQGASPAPFQPTPEEDHPVEAHGG